MRAAAIGVDGIPAVELVVGVGSGGDRGGHLVGVGVVRGERHGAVASSGRAVGKVSADRAVGVSPPGDLDVLHAPLGNGLDGGARGRRLVAVNIGGHEGVTDLLGGAVLGVVHQGRHGAVADLPADEVVAVARRVGGGHLDGGGIPGVVLGKRVESASGVGTVVVERDVVDALDEEHVEHARIGEVAAGVGAEGVRALGDIELIGRGPREAGDDRGVVVKVVAVIGGSYSCGTAVVTRVLVEVEVGIARGRHARTRRGHEGVGAVTLDQDVLEAVPALLGPLGNERHHGVALERHGVTLYQVLERGDRGSGDGVAILLSNAAGAVGAGVLDVPAAEDVAAVQVLRVDRTAGGQVIVVTGLGPAIGAGDARRGSAAAVDRGVAEVVDDLISIGPPHRMQRNRNVERIVAREVVVLVGVRHVGLALDRAAARDGVVSGIPVVQGVARAREVGAAVLEEARGGVPRHGAGNARLRGERLGRGGHAGGQPVGVVLGGGGVVRQGGATGVAAIGVVVHRVVDGLPLGVDGDGLRAGGRLDVGRRGTIGLEPIVDGAKLAVGGAHGGAHGRIDVPALEGEAVLRRGLGTRALGQHVLLPGDVAGQLGAAVETTHAVGIIVVVHRELLGTARLEDGRKSMVARHGIGIKALQVGRGGTDAPLVHDGGVTVHDPASQLVAQRGVDLQRVG